MRISDLIENRVVDTAGRSLGQVHDVLLIQDGPLLASGSAAFRLHGLVAGRAAFGTRLGYERGGTKGPAIFRALFRFLERKAVLIEWSSVVAIEARRVIVEPPPAGFPALRDALRSDGS